MTFINLIELPATERLSKVFTQRCAATKWIPFWSCRQYIEYNSEFIGSTGWIRLSNDILLPASPDLHVKPGAVFDSRGGEPPLLVHLYSP